MITVDGIITDFNTVTPPPISNIYDPIIVSPTLRTALFKAGHSRNAKEPINNKVIELEIEH